MKAVELTDENLKQQQKETERKNRYPAALPTAFVLKGSEDETQESRPRFESKKSLRNSSMRSDSADSVISHVPRNQDGAELPRKNGTSGIVKKRRMSTIDVLYQMQTQQLEEESPTTTCSERSIHPHSEFRTRWDIFVAFCLAYRAVFTFARGIEDRQEGAGIGAAPIVPTTTPADLCNGHVACFGGWCSLFE